MNAGKPKIGWLHFYGCEGPNTNKLKEPVGTILTHCQREFPDGPTQTARDQGLTWRHRLSVSQLTHHIGLIGRLCLYGRSRKTSSQFTCIRTRLDLSRTKGCPGNEHQRASLSGRPVLHRALPHSGNGASFLGCGDMELLGFSNT